MYESSDGLKRKPLSKRYFVRAMGTFQPVTTIEIYFTL